MVSALFALSAPNSNVSFVFLAYIPVRIKAVFPKVFICFPFLIDGVQIDYSGGTYGSLVPGLIGGKSFRDTACRISCGSAFSGTQV